MKRKNWGSEFRLESLLCVGVAVVASMAGMGCSEEEEIKAALLPAVSVVEVTRVDLDEEIHASGNLEARFHTMIAAEVAGRVTELSVAEGEEVRTGTTIIEIDPERRKLDLGAARARLAQARANFKKEQSQTQRIRTLRAENISSDQQLEEAETALLLARSEFDAEQAAVGVAARTLADASVSAPFDGHVARRSVQLGEFVQPGTTLVELVSLNPLEAIFSLTELDTQRVRVGQPISVRVGAFAERDFQGTVTFVSPTIDPDSRTLRIKAEVDNTEGLLRPGLFARISLGVSRREGVLMVPEEAVIQRAAGAYVFRIRRGKSEAGDDEDRVERIAVETGARDQGRLEIRGGLEAGDGIVQRGHGGLADGMVVAVRETRRVSSAISEVIASGVVQSESVQ